MAATRSSGSVRLTPTPSSTNKTPPAGRARTRSTMTTPGTWRGDRGDPLADARRRCVGQRVDGAAAEPVAGDADEDCNDKRRRSIGPWIAERHAA